MKPIFKKKASPGLKKTGEQNAITGKPSQAKNFSERSQVERMKKNTDGSPSKEHESGSKKTKTNKARLAKTVKVKALPKGKVNGTQDQVQVTENGERIKSVKQSKQVMQNKAEGFVSQSKSGKKTKRNAKQSSQNHRALHEKSSKSAVLQAALSNLPASKNQNLNHGKDASENTKKNASRRRRRKMTQGKGNPKTNTRHNKQFKPKVTQNHINSGRKRKYPLSEEKLDKEEKEISKEDAELMYLNKITEKYQKKYKRTENLSQEDQQALEKSPRWTSREKKSKNAVLQAARSELLLAEDAGYLEADDMERTHQFKQKDIADSVDITSANKYFELRLEQFGPYKVNYTRNGRYLLMGGQKGHLAAFDWQSKTLSFEVHAKEAVRDVKWLHQETLFAAAQKNNVYIYDNTGVELHCLKDHREVNRMEFLPYHFLLATVGERGILRYRDTSTGLPVFQTSTRLGKCDCMAQNPYNAVIHLGHQNGVVSMWCPTKQKPLAKMLCHKGPVLSTAIEKQGVYMATSGLDGLIKVWDIRQFKSIYTYRMEGKPAQSLAISQRGLLAAGFGPRVYVFKDGLAHKQSMPYMQFMLKSSEVSSLQFCPFEDVLGVGHTNGFTSLLVPGSGEPNFDALEANPYESKRQRQEHEVKMLLDKIQPEFIGLDPSAILRVDTADEETKLEERKERGVITPGFTPKYRMKGASSSSKGVQRKKGVGEESKRTKLKAANLEQKRKDRKEKLKDMRKGKQVEVPTAHGSALARFSKKK